MVRAVMLALLLTACSSLPRITDCTPEDPEISDRRDQVRAWYRRVKDAVLPDACGGGDGGVHCKWVFR